MRRVLSPLLAALVSSLPATAAGQAPVPNFVSVPNIASGLDSATGLDLAARPTYAPPDRSAMPLGEAWHGTLMQRGRPVAVGLTLRGNRAELWLPDQGIRGVPVPVVGSAAGSFSVQLAHWPGQPKLQLSRSGPGGRVLSGTFKQGGFDSPLTLWQGAVSLPPRPQEPREPLPYRTQEVTVWGGGATALRGTLTLPPGPGPFAAALLISGSGPQDRDSTLYGHRPFLVLADALTRRGFAVLRLDDRGAGGSDGDLYSSRYTDLVTDIQAGAAFLRRHRSVRPSAVGLIGHSEGASLAALSAGSMQPPPAFLVLLGGPTVPGRDLLDLQLRAQLRAQGLSSADIAARAELQAEALRDQRPTPPPAPGQAGALALSSNELEQAWLHARVFLQSPYLQDFLSYDPRPALRAVRVPTLAVYGSLDLQVPAVAGAGPMRGLLQAPGSEVHELDGLNHLLQPAQTGLPQEYAAQTVTVAPAALDLLDRWLAPWSALGAPSALGR